MTTRERKLHRAAKLREWAEKREASSAQHLKASHAIIDQIPMGQPILVGHHSEKRHRRAIDRSWNLLGKGVQDGEKAQSMNYRAAGLENAVEGAIYSDDRDRIERVTAKIAELEAERERAKAENKAFRKGDEAFAALLGISLEAAAARRKTIMEGYSWCRQPHPTYSLALLSATINKEKKRLAQWTAETTSTGAAATVTEGTPLERAGLVITATQTTPAKAWKKPRPVWNVTGNLSYWRPVLVDELGGNLYRGVVSFWSDPTEIVTQAVIARLDKPAAETVSSEA